MNERINDIKHLCYIPNSQDVYDMDKFAELIIKECIRICKDTEYYDDTALTPEHCGHIRAGAIFCREDIKQHFGVEE